MNQRSVNAFLVLCVHAVFAYGAAPISYAHHGEDWAVGSCQSRDQQSPVNFDTALRDPPQASFQFHYPIINNVTVDASQGLQSNLRSTGGEIHHDGNIYHLIRSVWHSESEHLVEGKRFPLELQLIHAKRFKPAHMLIVSILFDVKGAPMLSLSGADIQPSEAEGH